MSKGTVVDTDHNCTCGGNAVLVGHFTKNGANNFQYFVRCNMCHKRTNDRKKKEGAMSDWIKGKLVPSVVSRNNQG